MPHRHRLLAAAVAVSWGLNFIAIDASLGQFPPFFLVALRFAVLAIPTVLLVPRPRVETKWLLGYGLGFGTLQFLFLYWGLAAGMPVGLASLVLQASAPFTVILGAVLLRDRLRPQAVAGVLLACVGLAVVGWQRAEGSAAPAPFLLVLAGAFAWAVGNLCNARAKAPNPLHFTLWMSVVPPVPMLALSLVIEGPERIGASLTDWDRPTMGPALLGLAYTALIGTIAGSGAWSWLMARHPAGMVAPFSMLVPVVGMSAAYVLLDETVSVPELLGGAAVVVGVLVATVVRPNRSAHGRRQGPRPVHTEGAGSLRYQGMDIASPASEGPRYRRPAVTAPPGVSARKSEREPG
ncbi:EamA family transporter [Nocardia brevicatena]|uniref:EamA family transporter n=1 Tax=Nocardia brevicatena TaxID=37327 RepID=UPI0002FFC041|nr:EamA family transporter [Nocardia brevicatena]